MENQELAKFFEDSKGDEHCVLAAEMTDGEIKDNTDKVICPRTVENAEAGTSTEPSFSNTLETIKHPENQNEKSWSIAVKNQLKNAYSQNRRAEWWTAEMFFPLKSWPPYMVELFVLKNIAMFTYSDRNKICLFFWGNGATIETLFTVSKLYAPRLDLRTQEQQRQYSESTRKCEGLFKTYNENKFNPAYATRYYYYSLMENRMLYLDGRARHFGQRQEDPILDQVEAWAIPVLKKNL